MPEQTIHDQPGQQLSLRLVDPDYYDPEIIDPPAKIYRIDDRGRRFYYTLDEDNWPTFYGSVTAIKGAVLGTPGPVTEKRITMGEHDWNAYVKNRQQFGTFIHIETARLMAEGAYSYGESGSKLRERIYDYATENEVAYTGGRYGKSSWFQEAWKTLHAFAKWMADYNVKPVAVELPLADPSGFAGTLDHWIQMWPVRYTDKTPESKRDRIQAIVDVKSGGIWPGHEVQLAMNLRSVRSNYPERAKNIERVYNWSSKNWRTRPSYRFKDQTDGCTPEHLDCYLWMWKNDPRVRYDQKPRDVILPQGTMKVGGDLADSWEQIPIEEFIQQKHNNR